MEKMSIEEMQQYGVSDYYYSLLDYIKYFVNKNYPLSQKDIYEITNDIPNKKAETRKLIIGCMRDSLNKILYKIKEDNIKFLDKYGKYT